MPCNILPVKTGIVEPSFAMAAKGAVDVRTVMTVI